MAFIISVEMGKPTDAVQRKSYSTPGIEPELVSVEFSNRSNLLVEKISSYSHIISNSCQIYFFSFVSEFLGEKNVFPFLDYKMRVCRRACVNLLV